VASILARYPVARGEHVVLLEVGRRILVVHQASGSMTTLSELSDHDEVADIRARINGEEREKVEKAFAPALEASLEDDAENASLQPVDGMPGFVAETVDLTRRKRARLSGGAA
jgi:flagellar biogenesis protein FliO